VIFAADEPLVRTDQLRLLGAHNVANAMAAAAAALAMGLPRDAVAEGLAGFTGVPHRLEPVGEIGGVLYVNDSKATNVASAIAGITAFESGVHVILGGSPKGETFERLVEPVTQRCLSAHLIGEATGQLTDDLVAATRTGVVVQKSGTLDRAVESARAMANPGEVVLLSPACASFDQFKDFEERGERFRELVEAQR
jgi:UDP-N-acetylmuramoylalanine--D-glutamate ligase